MNYIKYLKNAGTITYANESRMPGYNHRNWYGGLVSGINGSRYSVHPGVYNFYTNEDGSISWGNRTGHIVKGSDGKQYVDFEVDPNSTARPELKTYQRFELGLTAQRPQTPIVEQATEQEIIDNTPRKVSTSVPIQNLAPQSNRAVIEPQKQPVQQQPAKKPITTKSNTIIKQPVPQNLLPYIANVTSNGVAFFNIPDGYTNDQFEEAVKAVYGQNRELAQKPMVYYEQPQQQIQQQKQQQQAAQQSQKQYQKHRQQTLKYITDNNTQTVKVHVENTGEPDLVTEVFAYPSRDVDVYNIHPEVYQKVLEYLNKNFNKTKTNNKPEHYVLSFSGFEKVPIGGEVNDSAFHYIGKDGQHNVVHRLYPSNANIINKNESFSKYNFIHDMATDDGKSKLYSYSNNDKIYYKDSYGNLISYPFEWSVGNKIDNYLFGSEDEYISDLSGRGFTEQQIVDCAHKYKNELYDRQKYNIDKSIFHPVEKEQPTQNNSSQQTSNSGNVVQKVKQTVKQTANKIRSFLGFQNGGQLKYYKNGK